MQLATNRSNYNQHPSCQFQTTSRLCNRLPFLSLAFIIIIIRSQKLWYLHFLQSSLSCHFTTKGTQVQFKPLLDSYFTEFFSVFCSGSDSYFESDQKVDWQKTAISRKRTIHNF